MLRAALVLLLGCAAPRATSIDASVVFAPRMGGDKQESVDGHVRCKMARATEITCALSHEGAQTLQVCFHAEVDCSNGGSATAEACRDTPAGGEILTYHAADGCDAIRAGRVTDAWVIAH